MDMDESDPRDRATEKDWRLEAQLPGEQRHRVAGLLGRVRGPNVVGDVEAGVPDDVVVTHDGQRLFAYAADRATAQAARSAIEGALLADGVQATIRISHWDEERERWLQIDPPLTDSEIDSEEAAERAGDEVQTRTLVATSGNLIRSEFEQVMSGWATRLGLDCKIIEHPHLLKTQVAFTVTGPKHRIDEFANGLKAEGWATVRTETSVMISPL
jgi:hypothetical protein